MVWVAARAGAKTMTEKNMNQPMTSDDRASEVMRRIALRNGRQKQQRERLKNLSFSVCVCALVTCYIATLAFGALGGPGTEGIPVTATSQTPLIIQDAGGYVLAGVIGFSVCAAIFIYGRKRKHKAPEASIETIDREK